MLKILPTGLVFVKPMFWKVVHPPRISQDPTFQKPELLSNLDALPMRFCFQASVSIWRLDSTEKLNYLALHWKLGLAHSLVQTCNAHGGVQPKTLKILFLLAPAIKDSKIDQSLQWAKQGIDWLDLQSKFRCPWNNATEPAVPCALLPPHKRLKAGADYNEREREKMHALNLSNTAKFLLTITPHQLHDMEHYNHATGVINACNQRKQCDQ